MRWTAEPTCNPEPTEPAATLPLRTPAGGRLLGLTEQTRHVLELVRRVAETDVTVLIRGENGTGKELVARAIHAASPRVNRAFVKINCSTAAPELIESELLGFERGAFTGAIQHKPGKIEFANNGTLFFDEVGELGGRSQATLLQVLQDGEFVRLGAIEHVPVDVRVVAASSRDLERAVADARFREDLFFRLNVVCIMVPPLRQRRDDIPALTRSFLEYYSRFYNRPIPQVSADTLRLFAAYEWPGNVRELEDGVRRIVILGSDAALRGEITDAIAGRAVPSLPDVPPPSPSLKDIGRSAAGEAERDLISRTLQQTRWNRRRAADLLRISYKALLYKIKKAKLDSAS